MALPLIPLKIDFWGIMPINLGGYNPHMALGPMGARGARPTLTLFAAILPILLDFSFVQHWHFSTGFSFKEGKAASPGSRSAGF